MQEETTSAQRIKQVRRLRDGEKIEEAIRRVYRFEDISELNNAWVEKISGLPYK